MADLKKRITSLTEKTTLTSGDFAAVDNTSGGTKKYNLYQLTQDMAGKADADGSYEGMTAGNAEQLLSDVYTEDSEPYKYRASFSGDREVDEIVGGTVAWNQLCNSASVTVTNGHKYLLEKSSAWSIGASTGTAITGLTSGSDMVIDLTSLFGSTIADYIYAQEQATAGAGVAIFRKLFGASYYPFNSGELISVSGLSAHIMRDTNNNIIGNYPLDSSLTLRGIPKLADGKMYFDGDVYASDGTVTRRFTIVDLGTLTWSRESSSTGDNFYANLSPVAKPSSHVLCQKYDSAVISTSQRNNAFISASGKINITADGYNGSASAFKTAMDGVYMVYELATATTETAEPYTNPQIVSEYGTEEYVSTTICPVGHNTKYPENLRKKIEGLPWDLSMIAPIENGTTASKAYSIGQYFLHNNVFCKAKTSIASGATFTLNTNYEETTVAAELYSALH